MKYIATEFSTLLNFRSSFKQLDKMTKKCAVGIDLGTTSSCVGVFRHGEVCVLLMSFEKLKNLKIGARSRSNA